MKVRVSRMVSVAVLAAVLSGVSGCVSYGNTRALITPVGVAGYHTFKPSEHDIRVPPQLDPDRIAAAKAREEQAADRDSDT